MVWHDDSGHWIPFGQRYAHVSETNYPLRWYAYCDYYGIHWDKPRILPQWAIDEMDRYYGDKYYGDDLDITDDN